MKTMSAIIQAGERVALFHYYLDASSWREMLHAPGFALPLISCWVDEARVYVLLLDGSRPLMASTPVEDGRYLAPSLRFAAADWGERVAYDLLGVEGMEARDDAPALDEGSWSATWPLSARPGPAAPSSRSSLSGISEEKRKFLWPERTGLTGPLGLSFDLAGARLKAVSSSAAFAHRGVLSRLVGQTPEMALALVSRMTAGGFVAHPLAFVRAVEQASGILPGPGIRDARFLLLEIERISIHLHDLAQTARAGEADLFAAQCEHAREAVATACAVCGVSRRLTDMVTLGSLREGLEPVPLAQAVLKAVEPYMQGLTGAQRLFSPRLQGLGLLSVAQVRDFAIGGVTGRASGRSLDLRRREAGMRLDALRATGDSVGDAQARDTLRMMEIRDSLVLIQRIIASIGLDDDEACPQGLGEGIGACEGARGDVWYWVRLKNGLIDAVHARDPSASLLPMLGPVLENVRTEHLVCTLRSFGLSAAGIAL